MFPAIVAAIVVLLVLIMFYNVVAPGPKRRIIGALALVALASPVVIFGIFWGMGTL